MRLPESKYRHRALRPLIRQVAAAANPSLNRSFVLTEDVFDVYRAAAGHPNAPAASSIARRLEIPWRVLVDLALDDARDWHKTLGARRPRDRLDRPVAA